MKPNQTFFQGAYVLRHMFFYQKILKYFEIKISQFYDLNEAKPWK